MKLTPHNFREAEYKRTAYLVEAEPGTTVEHITNSGFWVHVAARLRPRDRIEVHARDGSWMADMIVRSASRAGANVALLHHYNLAEAATAPADVAGDIDIKFRGPRKWSAIRKSDKTVLVEDLDTEAEVAAWLKKPQPQSMAA